MALYADAYGFTRPRLLADAAELWLGLVFVGVLIAGIRLRASWLPRAVAAGAVIVLFGLIAINPDAYVARTVIGRYAKDGHLDAAYLATLSADAVPELDRLPEPQRSCVLQLIAADVATPGRWYAHTTGRATAARLLAARPVSDDRGDCPVWDGRTYQDG